MPLATRERVWEELPPLDGEPEERIEKKQVHENVDGVDTVKEVEERTLIVRKLKCVEERKKWELFGLSPEDIKANDGMSESEEVAWEYPAVEKKSQKKQTDKNELDIKCRNCGGSHYTHQCPRKNLESEPAQQQQPAATTSSQSTPSATPEKYSVRDRLKQAHRERDRESSEAEYKVRITNLPEEATKADIENLCDKVAPVKNSFVKTTYQGNNTGFAFVTFYSEEDALKVCQKLNDHRYGYCVLHVEMAKNDDRKK